MNEPLLKVEDLHVSFLTEAGEVKAVNGLSYSLYPKEVFGIVGESGSGKSVSVNTLMKLLPPQARITGGEIRFDGRLINEMSASEIRGIRGNDISMVFQDPMTSLNPVYTIGSQLVETIRKHSGKDTAEAKEHAKDMLGLVGINNPERRMKQYPHELSGGMRQRVMIGMALCCKPKLLIADEPTTALDVTIQAQILDLMKSLRNDTDAALILITHDLGVVADICDKVIVMYAGRAVERGKTEDIFYAAAHPYTKGLIRCLPRLETEKKKLTPIEGTPPDLLNLPKSCPFAPRCDECMKICLTKRPPEFILNEEAGDEAHTSACWLHTVRKEESVSL